MDVKHAVAIVGIACRFPGGSDLDEFWRTLEEGDCRMEEIRKDRWSLDAFYDSNKDAPGKTYARHGAFIDSWDEWDNVFFGVNETEAARMDPQHRIALECVYKAMENAGISIDDLWGSDTSVYMGQMNDDMSRMSERDLSETSSYHSTGMARSLLANRVSYTYNLQGPSITLDTACSAGLVAVHQGVISILSGESKAAICGGVSIMHSPSPFVALSKARMASEKGKCHAFSDLADGYARGEGCGVVILKSIEKAKEDGDYIWGYIATAVNQDGHTVTPITAPSGTMQEKLLRQFYSKINLDAKSIQYVEAHGTGTRAGDPVEIGSLGRVIGAAHDKSDPCWVGSVKTNIGHTESAAGLAAIIKVLLMMKYGKIVPSLHFDVPNPNIDFEFANLAVPTAVMPWIAQSQGTRIGCVNCFGFGGTNAHAVLMQEQSEDRHNISRVEAKHSLQIVACSGKNQNALEQSMSDLLAAIKSGKVRGPILPLSYTSTARRSHFNYREAVAVRDLSELSAQLEKKISTVTKVSPAKARDVVFVFCGMGTHWSGMGMQLMQCEIIFRDKMKEIDSIIQQEEGWGVLKAITSGGDLSDPAVGQPAIFAVQVSLATLWMSWGVLPRVVIGHSVGEVAAAHIARKLTLTDAVKVICARGKFLSQVSGGSMLVIGNMKISDVKLHISQSGGKVEIAAQNSPVNCTISGDDDQIAALHDRLASLKEKTIPRLFLRKLPVKVAFHSHHLDSIVQPLGDQLKHLLRANVSTSTAIISTVSGEEASEDDFATGKYWQKNVRQEVLFWQGIQTILNIVKEPVFVEIGPKPALGRNILEIIETIPAQSTIIIPSMKDSTESSTIIKALSTLYACGVDIEWERVWGNIKLEMITFPRYQYQRKKLYFEVDSVSTWRLGDEGKRKTNMKHEINAGYLQPSTEGWFCLINKESTPFIYDHRRAGKPVIPAAMYAEVGLSACIATSEMKINLKNSITNVSFINAFHIHQEDATAKLEVSVDHQPEIRPDVYRFQTKGGSMLLSKGDVQFLDAQTVVEALDISSIKKRCSEYFTGADLFGLLETHKFTYGKHMRAIKDGVKNEAECLTRIALPGYIKEEKRDVIIHPAILDSCLQLTAILFFRAGDEMSLAAPVSVNGLRVLGDPRDAKWVYINITHKGTSQSEFTAYIMDWHGKVLVKASRIVIKSLDKSLLQSPQELCHVPAWVTTQLGNQGELNPGQTFHFYENSDLNQAINKTFESGILSISISDMPQVPLSMADVKDYFLNKAPNAILFSLGIPALTNAQFTEPDLQNSEACCISLLNIFKYCLSLETKDRFPIFVLTNHVHIHAERAPWNRIPHLPQLNMKACLIGSALWGLTRSAVREGLRLICIDMVHGNQPEINNVYRIVKDSNVAYPEWVLADVEAYRNEILPLMGEMVSPLRALRIRQDDVVQIVSKHVHGSLVIHQDVMKEKQQDSSGKAKVTQVRLHDDCWFATQWNDESPDSLMMKDDAKPLVALDYTAKLLHLNGQSESFGCQPIPLADVVHIDSRTLVPVSLFPSDIPMLSLWLVSWDVLKNQSWGSKHIRIHNLSNWDLLATCIRSVAIAMKCTVEDKSTVVTPLAIVLANKNKDTPKLLPQILMTSRRVVVISSELQLRLACRMSLKEHLFKKVFFYNHADIFDQYYLVKKVQKFKKWVTKVSIPKLEIPCKIIKPNSHELNEGFIVEELDNNKNIILDMPTWGTKDATQRISESNYFTKHLFKSSGCYILIGANKGLGLELLKHMAANGAGFLIAMSRSPPADSVLDEFELLKKRHNVQIHWVRADVAEKRSLVAAFQKIEMLRGRCDIKGIFNGAVLVADAILPNMTNDMFTKAYRVKVWGTYYLHCLTENMDLDYFVMHSSVTSIIGNIGQTGYGAANALQDGFAIYRRSVGLPGQSINWAALSIGLLDENASAKRHLITQGILPLEKEEILQCFQHTMLGDLTNISYCKFNWEKVIAKGFEEGFGVIGRMTFLAAAAILANSAQNSQKTEAIQISRKAYEAKTSESKTENYIVDIISEQLLTTPEDLEGHNELALADVGFTSMDAISIQSQIQQDFDIKVDILGNTTIGSLAKDVWSKLTKTSPDNLNNAHATPQKEPAAEQAKPFGPFKERISRIVQDSLSIRGGMKSLITVEITNITVMPDKLVGIIKNIIERLPHLMTSIQVHPEGHVDVLHRNVSALKGQTTSGMSIHPRMMRDLLTNPGHDISVQPPFDFHIHSLHSQHTIYIGMIFHRVVDDRYTINQFLSLFEKALTEVPKSDTLIIDDDCACEIQEVIDNKNTEDSTFLRRMLPDVYESIRMPSSLLQLTHGQVFDVDVAPILLDGHSYDSLLTSARFLGIRLKDCLLALFQLYIHFCFEARNLVIEMTTDLRDILPEKFSNHLGNLDNEVLLFSTVDTNYLLATTLEKHITRQCQQIHECVQHGHFSTQSMVDMINFQNAEHDNIIQFAFEFHEEHETNNPSGPGDMTFKVVDNKPSGPGKQAIKLHGIQRKSDCQLVLYLSSGPGYLSQNGLEMFSTMFQSFLKTCQQNMQSSLKRLLEAVRKDPGSQLWRVGSFEDPCVEGPIGSLENGSLYLMWFNTSDKRRVTVSFDQKDRYIQLSFPESKEDMIISFLNIEAVDQYNINGHSGIRVSCSDELKGFKLISANRAALTSIFEHLVHETQEVQKINISTHL